MAKTADRAEIEDASAREQPGVRVLSRGLAILKAFQPSNEWRSNTELSAISGLPKPTVSRLTANLTEAGYLTYSSDRAQYRLGTAVLALGYVGASNRDFVSIARPLMQEFADRHKVSVVLASPDDNTMVCNEVCHSKGAMFTLRVRAGSRLKLTHSALGRALIGSMGEGERQKFLKKLAVSEKANWTTMETDVAEIVKQMKDNEYCIAAGTLETGTNGIAVVVDTPEQPHSFALGCAAPFNQFDVQVLKNEIAPDLLGLKRRLEQDLSAQSSEGENA